MTLKTSETNQHAPTLKLLSLPTLAAFFAIYFIWGSTYLAIRVTVEHLPPLFSAGVRFLIAGGVLYLYTLLRVKERPNLRHWRNLTLLSVLMFVVNYGALFWAEKFVPSGIASVLVAMIPVFTIVFETLLIRHESFRWTLWLSIFLGFCGVAVLMLHGGERGLHLLPCLVILCGSMSWCLGSVLSRRLALPQSKILISGSEMMVGGILLLLCSCVAGELQPVPHFTTSSILSLAYLILFGSLLAYTAYVWLLSHLTATRVASYAYVNPVVAVAIGHWLGDEPLSGRTILGTGLVLVSVLVTLRSQTGTKRTTVPAAKSAKGDAV